VLDFAADCVIGSWCQKRMNMNENDFIHRWMVDGREVCACPCTCRASAGPGYSLLSILRGLPYLLPAQFILQRVAVWFREPEAAFPSHLMCIESTPGRFVL